MAVPATTGQLRTKVSDMEIGDYIGVDLRTNASPQNLFTNMGKPTLTTEIPLAGHTWGSGLSGLIYLVKVGKGLLVADRVAGHSVTWDLLNVNKYIQGAPYDGENINTAGIIRSLTGGVAYADKDGNESLTDTGFGAWPQNNEWDKYIVNFPIEKIQEGKTLDDVFHWSGAYTWTQDTPIVSWSGNGFRINRGYSAIDTANRTASSDTHASRGFRPVFAYNEE